MSARFLLSQRGAAAAASRRSAAAVPVWQQARLLSASSRRSESAGPASPKPAKGPSGAEAQAQGSDQRGKATTYILPITAVALVAFAVTVRLTSSETKQTAVNVGSNSDGGNDKLKGSKAKSIASEKANALVEKNIK